MKYCSNKDIEQAIRRLVREGWCYRHGSKHGRLTHPSGWPTLTVAKTPSACRSYQYFRSDLRQARYAYRVSALADGSNGRNYG